MKILFPVEPTKALKEQWLGLMYISATLKNEGYAPKVIRANIESFQKEVNDEPTILGYTTPTYLARYYLDFNKKVKKEYDVFSVFGGPHPTYYPNMIEEEGVDAICRGEGEYSMLELVRKMSKNDPVHDIPNLWVKNKETGHISKNALRPLISNLDELPNPDRLLLTQYAPKKWSTHIGMMSGRGCPFQCTYCFNHSLSKMYNAKGKAYLRIRSVDHVIKELSELISKYPDAYFHFWDDVFILDPNWLEEFSYKYKQKIDAPYICNARANLITPEIVKFLKESNCYLVSMGLETGSDTLRNTVLKRNMSNEQIINAGKLIKDAKMKLHTTNIIGIPKGSIDADIDTIKLNIKAKVDYAMSFILQPYKGTEIYDIANDDGLIEDSYCGETDFTRPLGYYPYSSKDPKIKNQIENLHKLFSFLVIFPTFLPLAKFLIKLPLSRFYLKMNSIAELYWFILSQDSLRRRIWVKLKYLFSNNSNNIGLRSFGLDKKKYKKK